MKIGKLPYFKSSIKTVSTHKTELLFSFVFAFILTAGYLLSKYSTLDVTPLSNRAVLANLFGGLVVWCVLFIGLTLMKQRILGRPRVTSGAIFLKNVSDRKLWLLTSLVIFICYIPIILTAHSMLSPDSWNSIAQVTGDKPLNNANPLIFTGFVAIFISLGRLFSDIHLGTMLFAFAQSAILALIFARVIVWMRQQSIGKAGIIAAFIFYAILPINSFAGLIMWKDILFAGFGLLLLMVLRQIYIEEKSFFTTKKVLYFIVLAFIFCTWRNNGYYAYALFLVLAAFVDRKIFFDKRYLPLLLAPFVLSTLYLQAIKLPTSSVVKVSVPLQQIARTVKHHDSSISNTDKQAIKEVLPYEQLGERYNPGLSDPIMSSLNMEVYDKDKGKLLNVWLRLSESHTKTYVAAFVYNNYGYTYPFYLSPTPTDILLDNANHPNALKGYTDTSFDNGGKFAAVEYRDFIMKPVSILHNVGFYTCVLIFAAYVAVIRKKRELTWVFTILIGLFITTIVGPVNGEFRYLYLFVVATPFVLGAAFSNHTVKRSKK